MTKHEIVHQLVKIQKCLFQIKGLSASGEIDRLCVAAIALCAETGDRISPDLIRRIREDKPGDPMM